MFLVLFAPNDPPGPVPGLDICGRRRCSGVASLHRCIRRVSFHLIAVFCVSFYSLYNFLPHPPRQLEPCSIPYFLSGLTAPLFDRFSILRTRRISNASLQQCQCSTDGRWQRRGDEGRAEPDLQENVSIKVERHLPVYVGCATDAITFADGALETAW